MTSDLWPFWLRYQNIVIDIFLYVCVWGIHAFLFLKFPSLYLGSECNIIYLIIFLVINVETVSFF